jgi:hypothetical protein
MVVMIAQVRLDRRRVVADLPRIVDKAEKVLHVRVTAGVRETTSTMSP